MLFLVFSEKIDELGSVNDLLLPLIDLCIK